MADPRSAKLVFKPRARLLLLLGDQLIRDPGIAVFELVKNAYDADAKKVTVVLSNSEDKANGSIIVEDDGSGMDWDTVTNVWLEPGTDHRGRQRDAGERSSEFKRLPLGEKGIGRFAVHKLGKRIRLITRKEGYPEVTVTIDWTDFEKKPYLSDVPVIVAEREPKYFTGDKKSGTWIKITDLQSEWNRGMARELHRSITSICSPFSGPEAFKPVLIIEPDQGWLEGLLDISEVLDYALFHASCTIEGNQLIYNYVFKPLPGMDRVKGREISKNDYKISNKENKPINLNYFKIGTVKIDLHIFDRDPKILAFGVSDKKGLKEFLDQNGGIRVYREGIRVYDFGEPGNDWLELGGRRVNIPTRRISNNLVLGAASLELGSCKALIEKTNREGFVENEASKDFRDAVFFAVNQIECERNIDKERIRQAYSSPRQREPVLEDLNKLREQIIKRKLNDDLGEYLNRIESDFLEIRDRLLTAAGAGLSLAIVIHEVEKGIAELAKAVERETTTTGHIKALAIHLSELIQGLTFLIRKSGQRKEKASTLIKQALFNTEYRIKYHKIAVTPYYGEDGSNFEVKCSRRLVISTLMNLIDNSIWWLDNKWGMDTRGETVKRLYIGVTRDLPGGPAIVIADNGPGFSDPPEYLVQPFMSRKPDGMGLGLHLASEVMKAHGGRLDFPEKGDIALPKGMDGAVVALVFGSAK